MGVLISSVNELLQSNLVNEIEIVIHGPAIVKLAKNDGLRDHFNELLKNGGIIGACSISMLKRGLNPDLLIDGVVQLKQGGVLKILELQRKGYSYIKI